MLQQALCCQYPSAAVAGALPAALPLLFWRPPGRSDAVAANAAIVPAAAAVAAAHHHDVVASNVRDLLVAHNAQVSAEEDDEGSPLMDVEPVLKGLCVPRRQDDIALVSSADSAHVIEQHRPCTQGQNTAHAAVDAMSSTGCYS